SAPGSGVGSNGLYKTTDGGSTWSASSTGLPPSLPLYSVVIDPVTPSTLYASTGYTVYKSTNGGGSWAASGTGLSGPANLLAIAPSSPATLYALVYSYPNYTVYKSTNGGSSWSAVSSPGQPSGNSYNTFNTLAVDPSDPSTAYLGGDDTSGHT